MSQANVQAVLNWSRFFGERDDEALFAMYTPDIEWDLTGYSPWIEQRTFIGLDGVRQFFRLWLEAFVNYEMEVRDPVAVAGERVVATITDRAVGRRSRVPTQRTFAGVLTLRDGKIVRIQLLDTRAAALEAVGRAE